MMSSETDETWWETKRIGHIKFWTKKMGFQHWWLINQVHAKEFTNPGGPPFFLTTKKKWGSSGWLIGRGWLFLTWHYKETLPKTVVHGYPILTRKLFCARHRICHAMGTPHAWIFLRKRWFPIFPIFPTFFPYYFGLLEMGWSGMVWKTDFPKSSVEKLMSAIKWK